jgi:hypothetical protein
MERAGNDAEFEAGAKLAREHVMFQKATPPSGVFAIGLGIVLMMLGAALPLLLLDKEETVAKTPPLLEIDVQGQPARTVARPMK